MSRVRTIVKPVGISRKKEIFYGQKKKRKKKRAQFSSKFHVARSRWMHSKSTCVCGGLMTRMSTVCKYNIPPSTVKFQLHLSTYVTPRIQDTGNSWTQFCQNLNKMWVVVVVKGFLPRATTIQTVMVIRNDSPKTNWIGIFFKVFKRPIPLAEESWNYAGYAP